MRNLKLFCLAFLVTGSQLLFAPPVHADSTRHASSQVQKACGVDFLVPNRLRVLLVDNRLEDVRCTIALVNSKRKNENIADRGEVDGYQELSDAILIFKNQPAVSLLPEFNFAYDATQSSPVTYVGQELTSSAKRLGYSQESVTSFFASSKKGSHLFVAEVQIPQHKASGKDIFHRRLDIVWGNDSLSVGSTSWCDTSIPRNCALLEDIQKIFESLTLAE